MSLPIQPPRELHYVALASVLDDSTFRLRPAGDISSLAQSIAQCGQLFPIELRAGPDGRWQPLTGFRRLEALRLLHRDRVLARLHAELPDAQAALVAAADAIDTRALEQEDVLEIRERYRAMGWSSPALEELFARALEKAAERLEDLAAKLRGEAAPDRSIPDEDSAPEPSDGAWGAGAAPALAGPPAPPALGTPRGPIVAAPPAEAPAPPEDGTALAPGTVVALSDAARGIAAAREGVLDLLRDLEDAAESMDRTAPPAIAARGNAVPPSAPEVVAAAAAAADGTPANVAEPAAGAAGRANVAVPGDPPAAPSAPGEPVTLDELAEDLAYRLSSISLDLASLADAWGEVPPHLRAIITDQLQYYSQLGGYLERASGANR
jgi:ParB-like chromosome segregation protein Spo0J